ncbi:MAG: RluA family pseudouridine synthase [Clostridiales bacterium]|nr:RluA family pseudouridine synthase [Clostridiales bacterium]
MKTPEILYEDTHLIVCLKPAGIPSQSGRSRVPDLAGQLKTMLVRRQQSQCVRPSDRSSRQQMKPPYIAVVHRLDQPVGGIMVYAKSREAAAGLCGQLKKHQFSKNYKAIVTCSFPAQFPLSGTLKDHLLSDPETNLSKIVPAGTKDAREAVLSYKLEQVHPDLPLSLLDIHLETGRHHQIRTQLSHHFAPLLGDVKYGFSDNGNLPSCKPGEIGLFAWHLTFTHPITGKTMTFEHIPTEGLFHIFSSAQA